MFGMGFGGGSSESYAVTMSLLGIDGVVSGLGRATRAWQFYERAQGSAARGGGGVDPDVLRRLESSGRWGIALSTGAGIAARGMWELGKNSTAAYIGMERVRGGLTTMLGSADAADRKIKELQRFAATTPFQFEGTAKAAQELLAMGISAKDLIPTMTAVGNATAAAGGDTNTFLEALHGVGEIKSIGRLEMRQLQMLAMHGIPALQILRKELKLTDDQVAKIGTQGIKADVAVPALVRGFQHAYGGGMERQMKTLGGTFSNTEDAGHRVATLIGGDLAPALKFAAHETTALLEGFEKLDPRLRRIVEVGAIMGVGVVGIIGAVKTYRSLSEIVNLVSRGKDLLTAATVRDTLAERIKTGVATREAAAYRDVARSATAASAAQLAAGGAGGIAGALGGGVAGALGAGAEAGAGMLALPAGAAAIPTVSMFAQVGRARGLAGLMRWLNLQSYRPIGNTTLGNVVGKGNMALQGIAAGLGAYTDYRGAGYGRNESIAGGILSGGVVAGGIALAPGVGTLAALGGGLIRHGVNRYYNDVLEREAQGHYFDSAGNRVNQTRVGGNNWQSYRGAMQAHDDILRRDVGGATFVGSRLRHFVQTGDWSLSKVMAEEDARQAAGYATEAASMRLVARSYLKGARAESKRAAEAAFIKKQSAELAAWTAEQQRKGLIPINY